MMTAMDVITDLFRQKTKEYEELVPRANYWCKKAVQMPLLSLLWLALDAWYANYALWFRLPVTLYLTSLVFFCLLKMQIYTTKARDCANEVERILEAGRLHVASMQSLVGFEMPAYEKPEDTKS